MTSTALPAQVTAIGPVPVVDLIRGEVRPAKVLGVFPTAMYLRLHGGEVVALLSSDAVRLPIGLVLSTSSLELPLTRLRGEVRVGSATIRVGDWTARITQTIPVAAPTGLIPNDRAIEHSWQRLSSLQTAEAAPVPPDALLRDPQSPADLVHRLLGVGPGLTPSGDDVLGGFLVGAWSFGLAVDRLRAAVLDAAPAGTTALSAALLRCASRGESIPQVNQLLLTLSAGTKLDGRLDHALAELMRVGHTSGAALSTGVVAAATVARRAPSQRTFAHMEMRAATTGNR